MENCLARSDRRHRDSSGFPGGGHATGLGGARWIAAGPSMGRLGGWRRGRRPGRAPPLVPAHPENLQFRGVEARRDRAHVPRSGRDRVLLPLPLQALHQRLESRGDGLQEHHVGLMVGTARLRRGTRRLRLEYADLGATHRATAPGAGIGQAAAHPGSRRLVVGGDNARRGVRPWRRTRRADHSLGPDHRRSASNVHRTGLGVRGRGHTGRTSRRVRVLRRHGAGVGSEVRAPAPHPGGPHEGGALARCDPRRTPGRLWLRGLDPSRVGSGIGGGGEHRAGQSLRGGPGRERRRAPGPLRPAPTRPCGYSIWPPGRRCKP